MPHVNATHSFKRKEDPHFFTLGHRLDVLLGSSVLYTIQKCVWVHYNPHLQFYYNTSIFTIHIKCHLLCFPIRDLPNMSPHLYDWVGGTGMRKLNGFQGDWTGQFRFFTTAPSVISPGGSIVSFGGRLLQLSLFFPLLASGALSQTTAFTWKHVVGLWVIQWPFYLCPFAVPCLQVVLCFLFPVVRYGGWLGFA